MSVQESIKVGVGSRIPIASIIQVSDAPYDLRIYIMMSPINGWFEESGVSTSKDVKDVLDQMISECL